MIDYSKKSKEHLFTIFLIGGINGFLDTGDFDVGMLIGRGIGMIIFAGGFGFLLHLILEKLGVYNRFDKNTDILDSDLHEKQEDVINEN